MYRFIWKYFFSEIDVTAGPAILHRSVRCAETCPAGPPGEPGEKGAKGDQGHIGYPGRHGEFSDGSKLGWCYLETQLRSLGYTYFLEKVTSTSKDIIVIKSPSTKVFYDSLFLCKSICGLLLKPESVEENDEILSILKRNGILSHYFIRISDQDETSGKQRSKEGIWRDTIDNSLITFTHWEKGQPSAANSAYDFAYVYYPTGQWRDTVVSSSYAYIICELPTY